MTQLYYYEQKYSNGNLKYQEYFLDQEMTIRHNDDGPAHIKYYENGNKQVEYYFLNNKYHNDNRPAIIDYDENGNKESEFYYLNGKWLKDVNSLEDLKKYVKLNNIN